MTPAGPRSPALIASIVAICVLGWLAHSRGIQAAPVVSTATPVRTVANCTEAPASWDGPLRVAMADWNTQAAYQRVRLVMVPCSESASIVVRSGDLSIPGFVELPGMSDGATMFRSNIEVETLRRVGRSHSPVVWVNFRTSLPMALRLPLACHELGHAIGRSDHPHAHTGSCMGGFLNSAEVHPSQADRDVVHRANG